MSDQTDTEELSEEEQAVLDDGYYATAEDGDNAVAVSEEAYVGVSPEYKNHAYDTEAPLQSEDEDEKALEQEAHEAEVAATEAAAKVGFRGYEVDTVHPSEAVHPADDQIAKNRAVQDKAAADAGYEAPGAANKEEPPKATPSSRSSRSKKAEDESPLGG